MLPELWKRNGSIHVPTLNDFVDRFFYGWPAFDRNTDVTWSPRVDINETDKEVMIEAELPGLEKKDIKVEVRDNLLTITGERKQEKKIEKAENCCVERHYGKFERSFSLGDTVNTGKVSAAYKNGVLTLKLSKKEAVLQKEVAIEVK